MRWLAVLVCVVLSNGCRAPAGAPDAGTSKPPVAPPTTDDDTERQARRRNRDPLVFVDGRPVSVMRFRELPPAARPVVVAFSPTKKVVRFSVHDYLAALGVDMTTVRGVFLHGGRARASVIPPDELRRHKADLLFQFGQQVAGKPMMQWPEDPIPGAVRLDMLSDISVFVGREPPHYDEARGAYVLPGGGTTADIPYAPDRDLGGGRLYLDGRLLGFLRRRPDMDRAQVRPLLAELKALGVDPSSVHHVEILDEDTVAMRVPAAVLREDALGVSFPPRNQGRVQVHVRGDGGGVQHRACAVHLWTAPEGVSGVALEADVAAQPALRTWLEPLPPIRRP